MKKLLAIIGMLLIIFIGMYTYKINKNQTSVTASEVENIENYISNIYMWKEITEEALPKFDNINDAPDLWVWEVVKKNLEDYELSYNQIQEKAVQIFGDNFKKQFPKEGSEYIYYDEKLDKYIATGIGLDMQDDVFFINDIKETNKGYKVEIIEYLEDYENAMVQEDESEIYDVYIKNLNYETIATIKSNESETRTIEVVKENIDSFTKKTINLIKDSEGALFVESVK
jgi:hypothetical protein